MVRYDAFISYSHRADRATAREVQRILQRLGKPWNKRRALRVYRDETDMAANPDLWATIQQALDESRWLVVLCTPQAAESEWVNKEIRHWREVTGNERIVLAVTAGTFRWAECGDFDWEDERSTAIPPALAGVFQSEPLLVDLREALASTTPSERQARVRDKVADVAAAVHEREKAEIIGDDLREHRRAMRLAVSAVALLVVLALTASGAGIVALANASRAESRQAAAEASEEQALAQADAAEALLAAADSPALAIERVMQASRHSDSPTVRSAMLAVATSAGRLQRAVSYPEGEAGHPSSAAVFDIERSRLFAWGEYRDDEDRSFLQVWELTNGEVEFSGPIDVTELDHIAAANHDLLVGCGRDGPVTIDVGDEEAVVTTLDEDWGPGRTCPIGQFGGGVLAHSFPTAEEAVPSRVFYIDPQGEVTTFDDVDSSGSHLSSRSAVLAGPGGIAVALPEGVHQVTEAPVHEVLAVDERGDALVRPTATTWAVLRGRADGWHLQPLPVPGDALEVVPILDGITGRMTDDFAWMTSDGTVGWTRDDRRAKATDSKAASPSDRGYATTLRALPDEAVMAVVGTTMTILRPPTGSTGAQIEGVGEEWVTRIEHGLGSADEVGADPVFTECDAGGILVLRGNPSLLVASDGEPVELRGRALMAPNCQVFEYDANRLSTFDDITGDRREIRGDVVLQGLSISATAEQVALVRPGRPIEILSTARAGDLPKSWSAKQVYPDAPFEIGFGRTQVRVESDGQASSVVVTGGSADEAIRLSDSGRLLAVRPDGQEVVWQEHSPDPSPRFTRRDGEEGRVDPDCKGTTIRYLPGPGFRDSVEAADAQVPTAVLGDGAVVNCRSGDEIDDSNVEVLSYEMDQRRGRIVSRDDGGLVITTWRRGDEGSIESFPGPPTRFDDAEVTLDEQARTALVQESESQEMTVYRRVEGRWERASSIASGLPGVVDAALVDRGTLVVIVSEAGGFELHDAASGRTLASDPNLEAVTGVLSINRIAATSVVGDSLYVDMRVQSSSGGAILNSATIEIPIGIGALTQQLCGIYEVTGCPA